MNLQQAYHGLLDDHGRQGWWPLLTRRDEQGFDDHGYHPGTYDYIDSDQHRFEVYAGSILTQNTAWSNAREALKALHDQGIIAPEDILKAHNDNVKDLIEPARYYKQKTRYLNAVARFYQDENRPVRDALLSVTGVGPETADTILLYAHNQPRIIADEYTKRWLHAHDVRLNDYNDIQGFIDDRFPRETMARQELHALIVADQK